MGAISWAQPRRAQSCAVWAIPRLTHGWCVWLPGGRMWGRSLGHWTGSAGSACKGLKCLTEEFVLCPESSGEPFRDFNQERNAIMCAFQKDPPGCPWEVRLEGVRLGSQGQPGGWCEPAGAMLRAGREQCQGEEWKDDCELFCGRSVGLGAAWGEDSRNTALCDPCYPHFRHTRPHLLTCRALPHAEVCLLSHTFLAASFTSLFLRL